MKTLQSKTIHSLLGRILFTVFAGLLFNCSNTQKNENALPIYGERTAIEKVLNGKKVADTIFRQIPKFNFMNQDGQQVTNQTFAQKIYVSDFFFTSCPTICPKMKTQMLRVYEQFKNNNQIKLLSHTLDPQHDSVAVLRDYAQRLGVASNKWHFVTGPKDSIYAIASRYLVSAREDATAKGGLMHSGALVLVDTNRHVRGIYDGTQPQQVDQLLADIQILLAEKKNELGKTPVLSLVPFSSNDKIHFRFK